MNQLLTQGRLRCGDVKSLGTIYASERPQVEGRSELGMFAGDALSHEVDFATPSTE